MLAKGLVAELTPPHAQSIWESKEKMIRAANQQHVVIISPKKKKMLCFLWLKFGTCFAKTKPLNKKQ